MRERIRATIEEIVEEELAAALGAESPTKPYGARDCRSQRPGPG